MFFIKKMKLSLLKLIIHKIKCGILAINQIKNWHLFILDHFKLLNSKYIIYKLRNGILYKTKTKELHRYMITETWIHKVYNKYFSIKENYVVMDIGANIGVFTIFAAFKARNGKVYSFEPEKETFNILKDNIQLNKLNNVTAINKAISNKKGKRDFFISDSNVGGHSFYSSRGDRKVSIETESFEGFIKENKIKKIDFLKLDCEGAEYDILYNCKDNTLKKIKHLAMETHSLNGQSKSAEMEDFLIKKGFKVKREGEFIYAKNYSLI